MRVDRLELRNYRGFALAGYEFAPRFNLVVGDNATGKTSLLNGLAFGLAALFRGFPEPAESFTLGADAVRLQSFWTDGRPTVEPQYPVCVRCEGDVGGRVVEWERSLRKGGRTTWAYSGALQQIAEGMAARVARNDDNLLPVLALYGTGRAWKQKRPTTKTLSPGSRFLGYLNCLDPASDEKRLLEWFKTQELIGLQRGGRTAELDAVCAAIKACIPDADDVFWDVAADHLAFRTGTDLRWFRHLSDGYRTMLGMVADIAQRCATLNPRRGAAAIAQTPGVVLIDELDLHLHPKWQRRVVGDLMRAFPNVQFVATTHSPFVIQSLPEGDGVRLINLDDAAAVEYAAKSVEDIAETVQKVDLPQHSQRFLDMMRAAEEYYRVLEQTPPADAARLNDLRTALDRLSMPFSDDPAYQAFLAVRREAAGIDRGTNHAAG